MAVNRRHFLRSLICAAPVVICASSLMPLRGVSMLGRAVSVLPFDWYLSGTPSFDGRVDSAFEVFDGDPLVRLASGLLAPAHSQDSSLPLVGLVRSDKRRIVEHIDGSGIIDWIGGEAERDRSIINMPAWEVRGASEEKDSSFSHVREIGQYWSDFRRRNPGISA